jgi:trans-aconitate methyltransferase
MAHYIRNAAAWQESWDRQQEAYLPDREHRLSTVLDAVEATIQGAAPRLLDLAGGTGSITLRALARFPVATMTVLDQDPVLLAIAGSSLADRATIVTADLNGPTWSSVLPQRPYDAVVTATALHWLSADRLSDLYAEIRDVLRPGGIFVNADHMPDDGLPDLTKRMMAASDTRREARTATGAAVSWQRWWELVAADPRLGPLYEQRRQIYPTKDHEAEWMPPIGWHLDALRSAGFTEVGTLWRGGADAAVVAVR